MGSIDTSEQRKSAISVGNQFGSWRLFWRLNWAGGADVAIGRLLACGAFVWSAYSIAQIMLNGVVIDEVLAPAQVIAGAIQYPPGHPHQIYYIKAYNLFHYLAAGVWAIAPAPLAVSAARNFLFLFATAFTPFALAVLLTGRPLWGHLAAVLTVSGIALRFEGIYPMFVFPGGASNGHIGLNAAMFIVILLMARFWRTGGLLLGLLPAIHPTMPLVIWPWSGAYLLFSRAWRGRKVATRLLCAAGLGLAICVALALIIFLRADNSVAVRPYDMKSEAHVDGALIHRQFTLTTDSHRRLAPLWWYGYSVGPVALLLIGLLLLWTPKPSGALAEDPEKPTDMDSVNSSRRTIFWFLALGGIASLYVYGAWTLQYWKGALPARLEMLMPYRFVNLTTSLLAPLTVAAMAQARAAMNERARHVATILMAGLVLTIGLGFFSPRYPSGLYAMWGMALAMDFYAYRNQPRRRWAGLAALLAIGGMTLAISGSTRFGDNWIVLVKSLLISFLICCLVMAMSALKGRWNLGPLRFFTVDSPWRVNLGQAALLCACLASGLMALPQSSNDPVIAGLPRWDKISQYDLELSRWLAANARPNEMILPAITPPSKLQPITNHPALMETESLWLMSYMPDLSPVIGMMMRDLYGVDYADRDQLKRITPGGRLNFYAPVWHKIWRERKRDEWQALGRKYDFRLVLAPQTVPLDMPVVLPGPYWTLYEIPDVLNRRVSVK